MPGSDVIYQWSEYTQWREGESEIVKKITRVGSEYMESEGGIPQ